MSQDDWYHGKLSRIDAENILLEEAQITKVDGIFLVRESSTSGNSFVLSLYYDNQFWHYQIQQHGEDAFFSISGENQPIHGLEGLIDFYRNNKTNLCTKLNAYVKKNLPPVNCRRNGKDRLLHRATKNNSRQVVWEILNTSLDAKDAKDELGQTAAHLACKHRVDPEIMKLLIDRGATLTTRDSTGNTALHYACENQCREMVELLVEANKNLMLSRNSKTGLVPLHNACKVGNLEIVKFLLRNGAPHMPRTHDGYFPKDFAKDSAVIEYLNEYKPPITTWRSKWNHGTLGRKEAFDLLYEKRSELYDKIQKECDGNHYVNADKEKDEMISGLFLVRRSERNNGYVITMLNNDEIKNYKIEKSGKHFFIDDGPYMLSLEHLISHYMEFPDGLPVRLRIPVEPKPKPPIPLIPPLKRKSLDNSPIKMGQLSATNQINIENIPAESPNKTNWMHSLPSMLTRKKKLTTKSPSKEEKHENEFTLVPSLNKLSFSTDFLSYDVPPPKKPIEPPQVTPADYFTESDTKLWQETLMSDNCIEEIYFTDPPVEPEKFEWNQSDAAEIYDTQKNLLRGVNQNYYVSMNDLRTQQEIGSGEFGNVLRGVLRLKGGTKIHVAVKTLHKEHYEENLSSFLKEAAVMIKLDNPFVVKLIGVTKGPPLGLVQELLTLGSLATYLVDHPDQIDLKDMSTWASNIAQGMEYLESKRFVHRDLAARNILLATKTHCKISDFGLSRAIGVDKDFYQSSTGGRWPLKWYAPENFFGTFSHASDVWSFGITLWEIYTKGQTPYGEMSGSEANEFVEKGHRLAQPLLCPDEIYKIMLDCWQRTPRVRPNFQFLSRFFNNLLMPETSQSADEFNDENDENDKNSNTVYV